MLLKHLPTFSRDPKRDAQFLEMLHRRYEMNNNNSEEAEEESFSLSLLNPWNWKKWTAAAGLFSLVLVAGTTIAAYQPSVTRSSFLYPVKQNIEKAELAFSFSPLARVSTHLTFSDRRLDEANAIIQHNPSLHWLVPSVMADSLDTDLDSKEAVELADTLQEMHAEVGFASDIVEKNFAASEAGVALQKIENTTDRHVEMLRRFNHHPSKKIDDVITKIIEEEDNHIAAVVEAGETLKDSAAAKQGAAFRIKLDRTKHTEAASDELNEMITTFQKLPIDSQEKFEDKKDAAKSAFETGKFGRAQGLSRSLMNRMPQAESHSATPAKRELRRNRDLK